ncbi:MAG: hypothetical protein ACNA8W_09865 [Bradymonadaceae bacterium]
MGLLSELTYTHLEVTSAIDKIEKKIADARRLRHESDDVQPLLAELVPWANGLRAILLGYFRHQQENLFPRMQRVFGADLEELFLLSKYHRLIIEALDEFVDELPDAQDESEALFQPMHIAYLELLFDDFVELYERHCVMERKFYETYSTILFPGGAIAD